MSEAEKQELGEILKLLSAGRMELPKDYGDDPEIRTRLGRTITMAKAPGLMRPVGARY